MRQALSAPVVAVMLALPAAAAAQDGGEQMGRYHITPSDGGFVRLDTETGTVSHCLNRDGTWVCEPAEEAGRSDEAVAELIALVEDLTDRLDRLSNQLDSLQAQIDRLATSDVAESGPPTAPDDAAVPPGVAEATDDEAEDGPSLAARLIAPLQQMVGDIRRGLADARN